MGLALLDLLVAHTACRQGTYFSKKKGANDASIDQYWSCDLVVLNGWDGQNFLGIERDPPRRASRRPMPTLISEVQDSNRIASCPD